MINQQVRKMNREVSGIPTPQPWKCLNAIYRDRQRKQADKVIQFPDAYDKDGYHINVTKVLDYEVELAACMARMEASQN